VHWIKAWYGRFFAIVAATIGGVGGHAQAQDPDAEAWRRAEQAGTADAYQEYLDAFPVGRFMAEAYLRLIEEQLEDEMGPAIRGLEAELY
jgi:hypothetical protein